MCYSLWQPINSTTSLAGNNANFNGNISAYEWTYKGALNYYWFHYDNLNRLEVATNAGLDAGTYKGERVAYDTMGNILGLTQYRDNENPDALEFFYNGNQIKNTYDASGRKLAMIYKTINYQLPQPLNPGQIISESYDEDAMVEGIAYVDNVEYSSYSSGFVNNQRIYEYQIDKIHSSEGYISGYSLSNTSLYHNDYRRDHLGNNREVWLGSYTRDGHTYPSTTVQRTQYYPSGLPWESAESDYSDTQHRKYNGKELVEMHGLDEYDSEARWFYPAIMRTTTIDPLAEKYYSTSPYAWCGNNLVNNIDLDGRDVWEITDEGRIINRIEDKTQDAFYMVARDVDGNYQRTFTTDAEGNRKYHSISFKYKTIESQRSISFSPDEKTIDTYDVYKIRGDKEGTQLFEFMSNNVTGSGTSVEVSQAMTGVPGDKGLNFITTGHMRAIEPGMTHFLNGQLLHGYTIRELNHSHPYSPNPNNSDIGFATEVSNIMIQRNVPVATFNIYYVPSKQKIPFGR